MNPPARPRSQVECIGSERTRCGYCRTGYTSRNFGVWAHHLDVRDYQDLLDAGWRRSGSYLYRPDLVSTCCPCYVIRLDAARFAPSSTQNRVLKRLRRFAAADALSPSSSSISASSFSRSASDRSAPVAAASAAPRAQPQPNASLLVPAAVLENRKTVSAAISNALDAILRDPEQAVAFPAKHLVDGIRQGIKVYPPRPASKSKKRKSPHGHPAQGHKTSGQIPPKIPGGTASAAFSPRPQLTSNVALLLASVERKAEVAADVAERAVRPADQPGTAPGNKATDTARLTKEGTQRRQMELATVLARYVSGLVTELGSVTVTEPGFLNFWVEEEVELGDDTEMIRKSTRTGKDVKVGNGNTSSLKERLRSNTQAESEQICGSLDGGTIPLSRIGSDVSSERTGGAQDYPSPDAPESARSSEEMEVSLESSPWQGLGIVEELSEGKSFTMELASSQFRTEAYEVFRKYQMTVHREPPHQCSEDTYRRFLVDSPLIQSRSAVDPEQWYGSFHMLYRMRGRLFAVGVVDVLPRCLSSVYLFYDPDFAKLSPGTLSAVKEIEWVRRASVGFPSLQFYYMGYYIHSCPKMRYKAAFNPSEILCEETKNWIPASDVQAALDATPERRLRLAPENMPVAPQAENFRIGQVELDSLTEDTKLQINFGHDLMRVISFRGLAQLLPLEYREQIEQLRRKIRTFTELVGKASSKFFLHDV